MSSQDSESAQSFPGAVFVVCASLLVIAMVVQRTGHLVAPILLALIATIAVSPLLERWERRGLSQPLAIVAFFGLFALVIAGVALTVADSVRTINANLGSYESLINQRVSDLTELLHGYGVTVPEGGLRGVLSGTALSGFVGAAMGGLGTLAGDLFLFLLALIFMLIERVPFKARAQAVEARRGEWFHPFRIWAEDVRRYVGLKTLTSLATAILVMAWLVILGVPFVPVWGLLTFLLYFIPNIGAAIAAAAASIVAFVEGGLAQGLLTGVGFGVVTTAMNNIVEPRFFGQRLGIDMTVILISLLLWGWLLGATGVLLAVPLTLLVKRFLEASPRTEWISRMMG